jgi:hypothetical protein
MSTNVVNEMSPELFQQLLGAVQNTSCDPELRGTLERAIQAMAINYRSPRFIDTLRDFLSILNDSIQIFGPIVAPYLPALMNALRNLS